MLKETNKIGVKVVKYVIKRANKIGLKEAQDDKIKLGSIRRYIEPIES